MDRNKQEYLAGLCAIALFVQLSIAQVPCEYDVTVIQAPTDCGIFGTVITVGLGINENGAVVGFYYCPLWEHTEAFVWSAKDGFVTLDRPEGVYSAGAVDINDNGVICGTAWMFDLGQRGFVYEDGEMTILHPVVPDGGWSGANAINNAGVVVGQRSITKDLNPQVAYMWSARDGFIHLDGLEKLSAATAINGDLITGWTANSGEWKEGFLWNNGKVRLLGPIPNGLSSTPAAVTNQGVIVGSGVIPMDGFPFGIPRAFIWLKGMFTMMGTLPDHLLSRSKDVNNEGIVVGNSSNVEGNPNIFTAFIWRKGSMKDLNDFIDPNLPLLLGSAPCIANSGQIVANGKDDDGEILSFLLTPLPGPLGDLSGDCKVSTVDLLLLLNAWATQDLSADFNDDGIVDHLDLQILLDNWG